MPIVRFYKENPSEETGWIVIHEEEISALEKEMSSNGFKMTRYFNIRETLNKLNIAYETYTYFDIGTDSDIEHEDIRIPSPSYIKRWYEKKDKEFQEELWKLMEEEGSQNEN